MIELRDVHKSFGPLEVLKGIAASVKKSEVVCIIGPSGSGKSTILRCINGLESYDAGDILVEGARVDSRAPSIVAIRTQVSMVFQRFNLFPHRTALENVIEGPVYVKNEPRAEAIGRGRALLAKVGLAEKADTYPAQLSGGQQQRVAIARALAMQPKLLLLDEIAGGLTEHECGELIETIKNIHAGGTTIVWIEHIVHALVSVASRLVVMDFGQILAEGDPPAVMRDSRVREVYMGMPIS